MTDQPLLHHHRFVQHGLGRWVTTAFLSVWLVGWGAGEFAAGYAFLRGLAGERVDGVVAVTGGSFLVLWLSLWTLGGAAALMSAVRTAIGRDDVEWGTAGVAFRQFPFQRRRFIARADIRRVECRSVSGPLLLRTDAGTVELTSYGTVDERRAVAADMVRALDVHEPRTPRAPTGWEARPMDDDWVVVERSGAVRRSTVRTTAVLAGLLLLGALWLVVRGDGTTGTHLIAAGVALLAYGAGWWAHHLSVTQRFLRARAGVLVRRTVRHGDIDDERLSVTGLELTHTSDSDGDDWYALSLVTPVKTVKLESSLRDPDEPLSLGQWVAHHTGVPLQLPQALAAVELPYGVSSKA